MTGFYAVRCPVCLREMSVPKSTPVHKSLKCGGCGTTFEFQNALPAPHKTTVTPLDNTTIVDNHTNQRNMIVLLSVPLLIAFLALTAQHSNALDGPDFLYLSFKIFLVTFLGSFFLRTLWWDIDVIRWIAFLPFELLCVYRLIWGYSHGMHQFGFLLVGMILGGALYFFSWDNWLSQSSGSGCSGGCGGGGCGGGCGGCGGCGG